MPHRYPILVTVDDRLAIVVGGGPVAERKARSLLEAGARVRVIAPEVTEDLEELARQGQVQLARRPWRPGDLGAAFLAVAATGDPATNRRVAMEAEDLGVLVNVVDAPELGSFTSPAVLRRGDLMLAVATSGRAPGLAGAVRRRLERAFGPEWGLLVEILAAVREQLPPAQNISLWDKLLGDDVLEAVRRGDREFVRERIQACRSSSSA